MQREYIDLLVGGRFKIFHEEYRDPRSYKEGADDEERVEEMIDVFL